GTEGLRHDRTTGAGRDSRRPSTNLRGSVGRADVLPGPGVPGGPRGLDPSLPAARPRRPGRVLDPGGLGHPLAGLPRGGGGPLPAAGPGPAGLGRAGPGSRLRPAPAAAVGLPEPSAPAEPHLVARARLAADR